MRSATPLYQPLASFSHIRQYTDIDTDGLNQGLNQCSLLLECCPHAGSPPPPPTLRRMGKEAETGILSCNKDSIAALKSHTGWKVQSMLLVSFVRVDYMYLGNVTE